MSLWIMGQVKSQDGSLWELGGVFSSREKAVAACVEPTDCVWPVVLDEVAPRETVEVGSYPKAKG
ncbi:hypothetical protein ACIBQX_11390 [Nonomuraea sp. NPDC049714]|uniref:hypothetical protein n=1 Tax=Nonomuraea sp. NPDC049714 TaxID=3364357 RepID=UPI0037891126